MQSDFLTRIQAVFASIDREMGLLGFDCQGCAGCCDPVRAQGHHCAILDPQPFLLELDLVTAYLKAGGGAWPRTGFHGTCRFLEGGRCSIYAVRPFDCRVYHCSGRSIRVYQKWIGSVEALCGEYADLRGMSFESYPLFSCFRAREIRAGLFAAAGILL